MSKNGAEGYPRTALWKILLVLGPTLVFGLTGDVADVSEVVANVTVLLGNHHSVDCLQIFRPDTLKFEQIAIIHKVWKNMAEKSGGKTAGVYTYERYMKRKRTSPWKVSCYKSLKILNDDEGSRKGYAELMKKFTIKDTIWIIFAKKASVDFFEYADVNFDDNIILAVIETTKKVFLYETYRISKNHPMNIISVGNWTMNKGLILNDKTFHERRSDLQGIVLRVGVTQNWPATYFKDNKWTGFLINVWKEIQSLMNCTSIYIRAKDNLVGMRRKNGSWNGLVGMALGDEIDVLLSEIVIDKERSHVLKFLYPVMRTRFQIYTKHLGYDWQWMSVLKPFHVSVWMTALAWLLFAAFFITFTFKMCQVNNLESPYLDQPFTPLKSLFFVMQALCQQGYHVIPESYSCRILFFVSYAVSGVLIPSYSASLVSSLAQKTNYRSFDSLRDMVSDGSYRLLVKENSAQHAFFAHTKDKFLKEAYEKLAKPVSDEMRQMKLSESITTICRLPKYALFGIEEIIEVRMSRRSQPECTIVPLTNPVTSISLTMATSRKTPYASLINYHLHKLLLNGMVTRIKHSEFPPNARVKEKTEKEVGLQQLISAFLFIGFFILFSVFLLFLEILFYIFFTNRHKGKRKKRHFYEHRKYLKQYENVLNAKFPSFY